MTTIKNNPRSVLQKWTSIGFSYPSIEGIQSRSLKITFENNSLGLSKQDDNSKKRRNGQQKAVQCCQQDIEATASDVEGE